MNSVGSPMRKPQRTSASSREVQAPGTRIVTLPPPPTPCGELLTAGSATVVLRNAAALHARAPPCPSAWHVGVGAEIADTLGWSHVNVKRMPIRVVRKPGLQTAAPFFARSEGCRHGLKTTHDPKVAGSNQARDVYPRGFSEALFRSWPPRLKCSQLERYSEQVTSRTAAFP
jgi:hypothetical protein